MSVLLLIVPPTLFAYSAGADPDGGGYQSCDALDVCKFGCPQGMHLVAPPTRSSAYSLRTGTGDPGSDPAYYVPGELLELYVKVEQRVIRGKRNAGQSIMGYESSKYIGLLLYAVAVGDATESKVRMRSSITLPSAACSLRILVPRAGCGRWRARARPPAVLALVHMLRSCAACLCCHAQIGYWEIPLQEPPLFWTPDDEPGCARHAVMHTAADPKGYLERLVFRAPKNGTGALTFRCLIKQGDTNGGAFYWPTSPASSVPTLPPSAGRSGGDLIIREMPAGGLPSPWPPKWSYRGQPGEACTSVCAAQGLVCDEAALSSAETTSANALHTAVASSVACAQPYLTTCLDAGPKMSGLGDGLCWYRDAACDARSGPACDAVPSSAIEDGVRLCPCVVAPAGRRLDELLPSSPANSSQRLDERLSSNHSSGHAAAAAALPSSTGGQAPCADADDDDGPPSSPHKPLVGHGAGGDARRCPNARRAMAAAAAEASASTRHRAREEEAKERVQAFLGASLALPAAGVLVAALLVSRWRGGRGGGRGRRAGVAVALTLASPASAHNWVRTRTPYRPSLCISPLAPSHSVPPTPSPPTPPLHIAPLHNLHRCAPSPRGPTTGLRPWRRVARAPSSAIRTSR